MGVGNRVGTCPFRVDRRGPPRHEASVTITSLFAGSAMSADKPHILVVDDENDILLIVKTSLKDDYDVETASNGPEALARAAERLPDLVILDMMMPEMDGIEVLERLRANAATARTPVIFLTGVSEKSKIREALNKGTQYYIVKPFKHQDLLNKVALALNEADTTRR
jgi:putative two-component system response regulator